MNNWWKNPVLQGDDNDYGQYDYLIEEIPENNTEMIVHRCRDLECSYCGKNRMIVRNYSQYFRTLDGYDYLDDNECVPCMIDRWLRIRIYKIKEMRFYLNFMKKFICAFVECKSLSLIKNFVDTFNELRKVDLKPRHSSALIIARAITLSDIEE